MNTIAAQASGRKLRRRDEQIVERRRQQQRGGGRRHREGADRQRRVAAQIRPVEHAADRAGRGAREDRESRRRASPLPPILSPSARATPASVKQDAGDLCERDALMAEQCGEDQGQQREAREDERAAPGRHGLQAVVQQRDQDAELRRCRAARSAGCRRAQSAARLAIATAGQGTRRRWRSAGTRARPARSRPPHSASP